MLRSRLTQVLQNYFDLGETRVRRSSVGFTPALINAFALQAEESFRRVEREAGALCESRCRIRAGNRGRWWQAFLPAGLTLDPDIRKEEVYGLLNGRWVQLRPWQDEPQPPDRVLPIGEPVPWQPEWQRLGDVVFASGIHPFPFRPWIEPDEPGLGPASVFLEGELHPWSPWQDPLRQEVFCDAAGYGRGTEPLLAVLSAKGSVPAPVRIHACTATMRRVPDPDLPHVDSLDRGRFYPAFWSVQEGLLVRESFRRKEAGLQLELCEDLGARLEAVCCDPEDPFLVAASSDQLFWCDRRELLPSILRKAAPTRAPLLVLEVGPHPDYPLDPRWVRLSASGSGWQRWRFSAEFPDGRRYLLAANPSGLLEPSPYTLVAGWSVSPPAAEYRLLLPSIGDYVFYAEAQTPDGIVEDALAWRRGRIRIYRSYPLEGMLSGIRACWFDASARLWVWTGTHVVRLREESDFYAVSRDGRRLFVSCPYERIRVEV